MKNCDCTSYHNYCENTQKIEEIYFRWHQNIDDNNNLYIQSMKDISEDSSLPETPCQITINRYAQGLWINKEFAREILEKLKETCPYCHKVYKGFEVLRKSFGPGITTDIWCGNCKRIIHWDSESDI